MTLVYGACTADVSVLDRVTTSQVTIAALLPMDAPLQVFWHSKGLINVGGTLEQVHYATDIAKSICDVTRVQLKNNLYDVEHVIGDS